jgi:Acetyltransferase (GNAT) domain
MPEKESLFGPVIIDGVLFGMDAAVTAFVMSSLHGDDTSPVPVFGYAFGIVDPSKQDVDALILPGDLIGGVIFYNHEDSDRSDMAVTVSNSDISTAHPRTIRKVLEYPFEQLKVQRLSAEIDLTNERSIRNAEKLGFKLEGLKRRKSKSGGDWGVFGLLPEECPIWTRGVNS